MAKPNVGQRRAAWRDLGKGVLPYLRTLGECADGSAGAVKDFALIWSDGRHTMKQPVPEKHWAISKAIIDLTCAMAAHGMSMPKIVMSEWDRDQYCKLLGCPPHHDAKLLVATPMGEVEIGIDEAK